MVDDLILILASVGTATSAAALLRRRARRTRETWPSFAGAGAGARQLADTLCTVAADPLPVAGQAWKSLAETLEPCTCHGLGRAPAAPAERWTPGDPVHHA